MKHLPAAIVEPALALYATSDRFTRGFARGKLTGDPVYAVVLAGVLPRRGLLVDLGCGRGLFLAALCASGSGLDLVGVERRRKDAAIARAALGLRARIEEADLTRYPIPRCNAVTLLDVLHYLDRDAQDALLARIASALQPEGLLLVREADAAAGLGFTAVRIAERFAAMARGDLRQRFCYRTRAAWIAALAAAGFEARAGAMREGTPFANDLIVARLTNRSPASAQS